MQIQRKLYAEIKKRFKLLKMLPKFYSDRLKLHHLLILFFRSPIASKLRHRNERPPHVVYHTLITAATFENHVKFVSSSDARTVLKFLPKPIPDDKKFHLDQFDKVSHNFEGIGTYFTHWLFYFESLSFSQVVLSLAAIGYTEVKCAEVFRVVYAVALLGTCS